MTHLLPGALSGRAARRKSSGRGKLLEDAQIKLSEVVSDIASRQALHASFSDSKPLLVCCRRLPVSGSGSMSNSMSRAIWRRTAR